MTGRSASSGTVCISWIPSVPGSIKSSSTSRGCSARRRRDSSRGSAGDQGRVARVGERVANMAQRVRVVVDDEDGHRVRRRTAPAGAARAGAGVGRPGHRDREGDASAEAHAPALGPDASAMGLDQALADGQAEPAADPALPVPGGGVLAEQLPEVLRRDAPALIGHRDRDVLSRRGPPRSGWRWCPGRGARRSRAGCSAPARCAAGRPARVAGRAAGRSRRRAGRRR